MKLDPQVRGSLQRRLRRARGQVDGILRMVDDERDCAELLTQLSAVSRALDRAAIEVLSAGLQQCAAQGEAAAPDREKLERLFLSLR